MAYRDVEVALRARIDRATRALADLEGELGELRARTADERGRVDALRRRLEAAGRGGGMEGVRRDRIDVAAWVLALIGLPLLYFHVDWHPYVSRDVSVIPAILWLGAPGVLAVLVAWPYRRVSRSCLWAALLGALFALLPFASVAVGLLA
jgi:hypothetical protein